MPLVNRNIDEQLLLLSESMSTNGLNILYIEDNFDDRIILEEYLADSIKVRSFESSETLTKGLELLKQHNFDLIFLDLSLPDGKGLDVIKKLIKYTNSSIPIIVLTGLNDHTVAIEALKYGAQDFFVKGDYNPLLLSKAIYYAIERHRVQHEFQLKNEELQVTKNRLSKAEEMADMGSWELDLINHEVKLSLGMKKLLGIDSEVDIFNTTIFKDYIDHSDLEGLIDSIASHNHHNDASEFEIKLIRDKKHVFHTLCRTEAVKDINGIPVKIYGVSVDISASKEAEQVKEEFTLRLAKRVRERTYELEKIKYQLEKSLSKEKELGELKSRFVSTASHQFRTPLTVIQSNIGLIEMQSKNVAHPKAPNYSVYTERIKNEVKRMNGIMNEVLVLGKISSGVIVPVMEETDVSEICKQIVEQHNQIQADGREASIEIIGQKKLIHLDKKLFEEAFSNILSNAFKYSEGKPSPEVQLTFERRIAKIKVKDHGKGIPEEDMENLFTPFFRASNVLDIPGNGLGTTIMKEYIEINKGTLTVDSKLNQGATFNIEFITSWP